MFLRSYLFSPYRVGRGGLYLTEFGTPSTGVANAGGVAVANDASTAWHNPAGMTHVSGTQIMGAAGLLIPNIKFDPDSDTPVPGGDGGQAGKVAPIIGTYFVHSLTDNLKFGFALASLAGAGLDYSSNWAGRRQTTEVELLTVDRHTQLGVQASVAIPECGAAGLVWHLLNTFQLKAPNPAETRVKADGDDWAFGYSLGALVEFSERTRLGVKYNSKTKFEFDGDLKTSGGLLGGIQVDSTLEIELPQFVEVGLYHEVNDQVALLATVDWEDWSELGEVPLSAGNVSGGIPTKWKDTYKLAGGVHYRPSKPWLLMTGFAYDSSPVDAKDRQAWLPFDRQLRYAVGTQYQWSERLSLGGNVEYIDLGKAKINNDQTLKGDYKRNEIFFFGLNANWKF